MLDQVGLMDTKPVALAPSEERAVGANGFAVPGRGIVVIDGIAGCVAHRSVWYSRCSSRALGSIDEMYICS
jgi:hypothetical protein